MVELYSKLPIDVTVMNKNCWICNEPLFSNASVCRHGNSFCTTVTDGRFICVINAKFAFEFNTEDTFTFFARSQPDIGWTKQTILPFQQNWTSQDWLEYIKNYNIL